jgi:hypothetical protein
MTDTFTFNVYDVDLPTQHILLKVGGLAEQRFDIPGIALPTDGKQRFWALYNKLVELEAIPNRTPVFNA